jgi:hypothetical protein
VNARQLDDALRACARGIHPLEAGTGLLIDCGSWLHREDFTSRFIMPPDFQIHIQKRTNSI